MAQTGLCLLAQARRTGIAHPTTVSPSSYITPYTPLSTDAEEAATVLKANEPVKIQLGAQIDGLGTVVCDTILVKADKEQNAEVSGREADLMLATYYANELLLRLMIPPGLLASGTDEEKKKAAAEKRPTPSKMTQMLETVAKSYECNIVEGTTSWLFERNEIEGKKKIVLLPTDKESRTEGVPEVGDVWGVEMGLSLGSGKYKVMDQRPTLHRRTTITYQLKRPSSRQTLSEIVKKFGNFPFSLRQLDDERAAKVGVVECVRSNVLRQYDICTDKDNAPVARLLTTIGEFPRIQLRTMLTQPIQLSPRTALPASARHHNWMCPSTRQTRRSPTSRSSRFSNSLQLGRLALRGRTKRKRRSRQKKRWMTMRSHQARRINSLIK